MKKILFTFFFLSLIISLVAQELAPCGTTSYRSKWLKRYQSNPSIYPRTQMSLYIPLKLHIVGTDAGKAYISPEDLLGSLCTLNSDFEEANIQFYIDGDINYIDNSDYYFHSTILEGADMMFENNLDSTINNYIVSQAAGNCGYNLPYAGVCMSINCTQPDDHTWAHELGHNFSLPHPFLGWEGGVSHDGSIEHNFSTNAPDQVVIDYTLFKDTLIRDTIILDTVFVEKVDRSNCQFAADGFCDTQPDYLAIRWNCNSQGLSPAEQTDPNGQKFRSDASLIMSYALDECSNRFTQEQIDAMRANIIEERPYLLKNQSSPKLISDPTIIFESPIDGELVDYKNINLSWVPVEGATHYAVKVSTNEQLTSTLYTGITSSTSALVEIDELFKGRTIYWSIIPFNSYDFCNTWMTPQSFTASEITSTDEKLFSINMYPNILTEGRLVNLSSLVDKASLYNVNGQLICEYKDVYQFRIDDYIENGLYLVELSKGDRTIVKKLIISN